MSYSTQEDFVSGRKKKKKRKKKPAAASELTQDSTNDIENNESANTFCDPCQNVSGKTVAVEAFCSDCCEYLCKSCSDYHTKLAATKTHILKDKQSMPKDKPKVKLVDKCLDQCLTHSGKVIEYFCKDCDQIGCNVCVTIDHRDCSKVDYIANIVNDLEDSNEFKKFKVFQNTLSDELQAMENRIKFNSNKKILLRDTATGSIKQQKDDAECLLKKWESNILEKLDKTNKDYEYRLESSSKKQRDMCTRLQSMSLDLEQKQQRGEFCQLFIAMKKGKKEIQKLAEELKLAKKDNVLPVYQFVPSKHFCEVEKCNEGFGTLTSTQSEKGRLFEYRKSISVKSKKNTYSNWVSSVCVLSENMLVAADNGSQMLKVINICTGEIVFMLKDPAVPAGATKIGKNEIAVTIKEDCKVIFLSVLESGVLEFKREIKVEGECVRIAYTDNKLIISFCDPQKVEIVDIMDGTVLKRISKDMEEYRFLKHPAGVAVGRNKKVFYVTDNMEDTVTCMTFDGDIIAIYRDIHLREPWDVVVDENGSVFVSCGLSANIHQLSEDCSKVGIFVERGPGPPCSMDYCEKTKRLYVGRLVGECINVYDVK